MVEKYTHRQFSNKSDALPALFGLARRESKDPQEYLAGLWLDLLPDALAWIVAEPSPNKRPRQIGPPSWTWASLPPAVSVKFSAARSTSESRVMRHEIKPKEKDRLGAVESGWIELNAAVRSLLRSDTLEIECPRLLQVDGNRWIAHNVHIQQDSYAVSRSEGKLMYLKSFEHPIVISVDCGIPEGLDLRECLCVQISSSTFLLSKKSDGA
jgi:hypothetical protein